MQIKEDLTTIARVLEDIDANNSYCFTYDLFFNHFCELLKGGYFKKLTTFPNTHSIEQYLMLYNAIKENPPQEIKSIKIFKTDGERKNNTDLMKLLLPVFTNLTTLNIAIQTKEDIKLLNIVDLFNNLSLDTLHLNFNSIDDTIDDSLKSSDNNQMNFVNHLKMYLDPRLKVQCSKLVNYLRFKFPNINDLSYNKQNTVLYQHIFLKLLNYLSKMKKYSIENINIKTSDLHNFMDNYSQFSRQSTDMTIIHNNTVEPDHVIIKLSKEYNKMNIEIYTNINEEKSFKNLLEKFGVKIKSLVVKGSTSHLYI